ncbi:hypothetical protein BGZ76_006918 [Entomortierella beljakovae]|nr:hypothetical protein BGZ76_006918 [Entomortierella beljakovae]
MTTTRRSSRSNAAAAAAADPQVENPTKNTAEAEQTVATEAPATEEPSVKEHQAPETTESAPSTTESAESELPTVTETVDIEIEKSESTETNESQEEQKESNTAEISEESSEPVVNSIHLIGHIKGLPSQVAPDTEAIQKELLENHKKVLAENNMLDETSKLHKRPIENDSNTVEESDYSAGAYKSPFRHSGKGGNEDRL